MDAETRMCSCADVLDGYRYDPPTDAYVHAGCGQPRTDGPTVESVVAFAAEVLESRRRRETEEQP